MQLANSTALGAPCSEQNRGRVSRHTAVLYRWSMAIWRWRAPAARSRVGFCPTVRSRRPDIWVPTMVPLRDGCRVIPAGEPGALVWKAAAALVFGPRRDDRGSRRNWPARSRSTRSLKRSARSTRRRTTQPTGSNAGSARCGAGLEAHRRTPLQLSGLPKFRLCRAGLIRGMRVHLQACGSGAIAPNCCMTE